MYLIVILYIVWNHCFVSIFKIHPWDIWLKHFFQSKLNHNYWNCINRSPQTFKISFCCFQLKSNKFRLSIIFYVCGVDRMLLLAGAHGIYMMFHFLHVTLFFIWYSKYAARQRTFLVCNLVFHMILQKCCTSKNIFCMSFEFIGGRKQDKFKRSSTVIIIP